MNLLRQVFRKLS